MCIVLVLANNQKSTNCNQRCADQAIISVGRCPVAGGQACENPNNFFGEMVTVWSVNKQRWSPRGRPWPRGRPRGHIFKSLALALASKVKSLALALASKPQVLENCPVLGSRTALFFEQLKFRLKTPETLQKICEHLFFVFLTWSKGVAKRRGSTPLPN